MFAQSFIILFSEMAPKKPAAKSDAPKAGKGAKPAPKKVAAAEKKAAAGDEKAEKAPAKAVVKAQKAMKKVVKGVHGTRVKKVRHGKIRKTNLRRIFFTPFILCIIKMFK